MQFKIKKNWFGDGNFFNYNNIDIDDKITYLIGCNGSGKSTLMQQMQEQLKKEKIDVLSFDGTVNNTHSGLNEHIFLGEVQDAAALMAGSEGEQVMHNFGHQLIKKLGHYTYNNEDKPLWIFIDASDSGLSIDHIISIKEDFLKAVIEKYEADKDRHFVISTNAYEFVRGEENCIDVTTGKKVSFRSYEDYRQKILETAKRKEKREKRCRRE